MKLKTSVESFNVDLITYRNKYKIGDSRGIDEDLLSIFHLCMGGRFETNDFEKGNDVEIDLFYNIDMKVNSMKSRLKMTII